MNAPIPRLHIVTNDAVLTLPDFRERVDALARVENVAIHLRGCLPGRKMLQEAERIREAGVILMVNDRVDIARIVDASGVHLPEPGLPVSVVRDLVSHECWIGRSVHSVDAAVASLSSTADYVFLGPVWETASHPKSRPIGLDSFGTLRGTHVIGIGGVRPDRVTALTTAGAYGVAAIQAVWTAADPYAVARDMLISLEHGDD